jgi:phage FluMu protein Com
MSVIEQLQRERRQRWLRDWGVGLASCYYCDKEYADAEVIVLNEEKSCPHCKEPERKTYYYCKEHGSSSDDCER